MNPEYIVLAGWWWRLTRKKVSLWYNHTVGSFWLWAARPFIHIVFHTSPYAYTARYKNAQRMPAGIDTEVFKPHPEITKIPRSIYFQGRVTPAKRVHVILEAFAELYKSGDAQRLTIVGPENGVYVKPLKEKYAELIEKHAIVFTGPVLNAKTPELYAAHEVSVNLTDDGNYDKTVLESLACGIPCIVSSRAFNDAPVTAIDAPTAKQLAIAIRSFKGHNGGELITYVQHSHSLSILVTELKKYLS